MKGGGMKDDLPTMWYEQNELDWSQYDIAVEIRLPEEQLEWGITLRQNSGTIHVEWGDGIEEDVRVLEKLL